MSVLRYFFCFFCLTANIHQSFAQVTVNTSLSQNRIFMGDKTQLVVEINYTDDCEIENINADDLRKIGIEVEQPTNEDYWTTHRGVPGGTVYKTQLILQHFEPDTLNLPPLKIIYNTTKGTRDTAFSSPLPLTIFPILPDSTGKLMPIEDIIAEPNTLADYQWYIISGIAILLAIGVAYYFHQKRMQKGATLHQVSMMPPKEKAMKRLQSLSDKNLWQSGNYDAYCTELSYTLRSYLEEQYFIAALENPSSEVLDTIREDEILHSQYQEWQYLFTNIDFVKYGNADLPTTFYENAISISKNLING